LSDQREKLGTGLGTWSTYFTAWSGSPYRSRNSYRGGETQNGTNETRNAYILWCLALGWL